MREAKAMDYGSHREQGENHLGATDPRPTHASKTPLSSLSGWSLHQIPNFQMFYQPPALPLSSQCTPPSYHAPPLRETQSLPFHQLSGRCLPVQHSSEWAQDPKLMHDYQHFESEVQRQFMETQSDRVRSAFGKPWSQAQGDNQAKTQLQLPSFAPARLCLPKQLPTIQHDISSPLRAPAPKLIDLVSRADYVATDDTQIGQPEKRYLLMESYTITSCKLLGVSRDATPYE